MANKTNECQTNATKEIVSKTICPKTGKDCEDTGCNFVDCAAPSGYWSDNKYVNNLTNLKKEDSNMNCEEFWD